MAQQINLYDAGLRPKRELLTPLRLLLAVGGVLALLAAAGAWLQLDAQRWQRQLDGLQAQQQQITAALKPVEFDERALQTLRDELAQARALAAARPTPQQAAAPAAVLRALSAAASGELWLQAISWQAEPAELGLEGGVLDAARLPAYLRRLERQPQFEGLQFQQLQLDPVPLHAHSRFALRSQAKEGGP
jgi:hypothetical protein